MRNLSISTLSTSPAFRRINSPPKGILEVRDQLFAQLPQGSCGTAQKLAETAGLTGQEAVVAGWLNRAAANPEAYNVERKFSAAENDWVYTVK